LKEQQYIEILSMLFYSNFLTINIWQSLCSAYFLFTFGFTVERKLGPIRFLSVVILGATIPWIVQFCDVLFNPIWPLYFEHLKSDTYFFGPAFILCTLASAYKFLTPKKKTHDFYVLQSAKTPATEIFNSSQARPVTEHFGLPPEVLVSGFIVYEIVQRAFVILPWKDLDTIGLYAAIVASLIGWFSGVVVLSGLKDRFSDHPLRYEAVRRYYDLLDLDISSENAITGAAMALGLPDEQVHAWVKADKGKLRTK
jgi:membrane associated rhomboid family serine protease